MKKEINLNLLILIQQHNVIISCKTLKVAQPFFPAAIVYSPP